MTEPPGAWMQEEIAAESRLQGKKGNGRGSHK